MKLGLEPILRDTLLIGFCWLLPIIVSVITFFKLLIKLLAIATRNFREKSRFFNWINRLYSPIHLVFTIFGKKIPNYVFFGIYAILLLSVSGFYIYHYFFTKPIIIKQSYEERALFAKDDEKVEVVFDKPINIEKLNIVTSPEGTESIVEFASPLSPIINYIKQSFRIELPPIFYTKAYISPKYSITYDTGLLFYLNNISNISGTYSDSEHAINLTTPKFPEITGSFPNNGDKDIPSSTPIILQFSSEINSSYGLTVESNPEIDVTFKPTDSKQGQLIINKPLKQETKYHLTLISKKQRTNLQNHTIINSEEVEGDYILEFTTVASAGIKNFSPKGNSVNPKSKIEVNFRDPMDTSSFNNVITITPSIEYESSWDTNEQLLTITPKKPLEKATVYKVSFAEGIKTKKSGILTEKIENSFETLGYVKVSNFSPRNNSSGNSVGTNISIAFDQEIDHADAQKHISISPSINATYSWSGNTLTINPKNDLKYSTKYVVTIKPGIKSIEGMDSKDSFTYSFTTRSQVVTIWVPRYIQPGYFDCNVTAASMALAAKGVSASVSSIKSAIGVVSSGNPPTSGNPNTDWIDSYGVHPGPIATYIQSRGRGAVIKSGWSLAGVASEIQKGNPVIIWWWNGSGSTVPQNSWYSSVGAKRSQHSVVVYGFIGNESNPTGFYVRDPWFAQSYYSAGTFLSRWNYMNRKAVVVK